MSKDLDNLFKSIVLMTGFGPFVNHPINASWEAVKLMNKNEIEMKHNIEFVPMEISVTYDNVDEYVPALWEAYEPKLMIHVGVSSIANHLTLETQAHRKGYKRLDYCDKCPEKHTCLAEGAIRLHTKLNVDRICNEFNDECSPEMSAVTSCDAGRYLCEYIYYTSLSHDNRRTLFVHVPDTTKYRSEVTARGLERIMALCLKQIQELDRTNEVTHNLNTVSINDDDSDDELS